MTLRETDTAWPAGTPCWADLMTSDVDAARAFYGTVLGWDFAQPDETFGYVVAERRSAPAAGIGPAIQGARTAWTLHFAADDADAVVAAVPAHGGTVLAPPREVGELGRMALVADPAGAVFGVWETRTFAGAGIVSEPGGLAWVDLHTPDADACKTFYSAVFGFSFGEPMDGAVDYVTFQRPGSDSPLGGIAGQQASDGAAGAAQWIVYFAVEDADIAAGATQDGGGAVVGPPFDSPYGRIAALADPDGAPFWVVAGPA